MSGTHMEDLERWMKIIEDGPDAEEVLADQEEEGTEELEEAGCKCGSYDCESCFPSDDVAESVIDENEIFDQVIDLAEDEIDEPEDYEYDNEYTAGTDTESDDVELDEQSDRSNIWKDENGIIHGEDFEVFTSNQDGGEVSAYGSFSYDPATEQFIDVDASRGYFGDKDLIDQFIDDIQEFMSGVSESEEDEWTSADADYFDDELPCDEPEWNPDVEEIRALAGLDGIGMGEQYNNADGEDSPFTDSSMDKDLEEAEPEVADEYDDEDDFEADDTIVDLGDEPDLEPDLAPEPEGEVGFADADQDVGDLIAKIQYMQDMGISMSDRYYDADKLWAMKPEFIQRIHSKVVGESIDGYDVEELDSEEIDDSDYDMGGEEISDKDYEPVPEGTEAEMQTQAADDESEAYANFSNSQDNVDESLNESADQQVVQALNALFG